ncbi:MAG: hypothetical protein K2X77_16195 [Candidatus Obscuribacterales bacterium]|nr:hypothetical protein [Candidatus Obscuribacterales bacterium]
MVSTRILYKADQSTRVRIATWKKLGFVISALLLCFAVGLECGIFSQRIKPKHLPEPTGKFGWSIVLPRTPARLLFSTGPAWFVQPLKVDVDGQLLKKSGAGFDEILNTGDGRFNQFGERVFFSLPHGVGARALSNITVIRPVFFHPWIEALILASFLLFLRFTYIAQAKRLAVQYGQWCLQRQIPSCMIPLTVIGILMFVQISQTLPARTVFFNPDSGGYLSPETIVFRRPFGYVLFLKTLVQLTGELWLAGPIQWIAYAASVLGISCLFEKYFKNPFVAFVLGTLLLCKCSMIKWAYSIMADCLFGALLVWFFIGIVSLVVEEKPSLKDSLQVGLSFAAALALRPIGAFMTVMPIFTLFAAKSRRKVMAILLSTALLVPLICGGVDKALAQFWQSPNPNFKSTGICLLGSLTWFLDKSMQTEYPQLRDLIVDSTADLRTRYKNASISEKISMDHHDIFPITWERLPAALEQWKRTPEASKFGIKSADDIYSVSVDRVFTRLALQTAVQRAPQVLDLGLVRAQDVLTSRLTGEWLVPLYFQLSGMEAGITDQAGIRWSKRYPFTYFETKDPGNINLVLETNRHFLNVFVIVMFLLTCNSLFGSLCSKRAITPSLKVVTLAWFMAGSYFGAVACMQPVLDRYSEPIVPIVLFAAFGQFLFTIQALRSFCVRKAPLKDAAEQPTAVICK